jgi:4'-phosphopantetheinyl transferase superfamily
MIAAKQVADGVWLGVSQAPSGPRSRGASGRQADRTAAGRAWSAALGASGLSPESAAASRAHTEGSGAAIVGPLKMRLGVDLVAVERVTLRHAGAILEPGEWNQLPVGSCIRPALAWGLKEAAAKAFGDPGRSFPARLRITRTSRGLGVVSEDYPRWVLWGDWERMDHLLCVWVLGAS